MASSYISAEMIRGHIDTFILLALKFGDKDSNDIRLDIEARSDNKYSVKQGTFYSAMQRLVKQNYISEYRSSAIDGIRRKYYSLTEKGRNFLTKSLSEWDISRDFIDEMVDAEVKSKPVKEPVAATKDDEFEDLKSIVSNAGDNEVIKVDDDDSAEFFGSIGEEVFKNLMDSLESESEPSPENEIVKEEKNDDNKSDFNDNYETETQTVIDEIIIDNTKIEEEIDLSSLGYKEDVKKEEKPKEVKPEEPASKNVNYKEILGKLFPKTDKLSPVSQESEIRYTQLDFDDIDEDKAEQKDEISEDIDELPAQSAAEIDFGDLYEMAKREGFKIRTSHSTNKRFDSRIFINRLRSDSSLIFYAVLFVEMLIMKLAFGSILNWHIAAVIALPVVLFMFPLAMTVARVIDPLSTVGEIKQFRDAMEIALLITFQILIIIFGVALFVSVDFNNSAEVLNFIIIPGILAINIPIYIIIKYALLSGGKYFQRK